MSRPPSGPQEESFRNSDYSLDYCVEDGDHLPTLYTSGFSLYHDKTIRLAIASAAEA
jgi:hypothetical protein